ncbi:Thioesterase [Georgfuchsia toluolica]|uniref:Thioesterase n=1 Tax=Georgfuchsia toluolica TaxID=424218 RepID=A0A916J1X0_9PROT|nr:thioesterase family protein [Georgfuchsia toluolica]CAG4882494.1 Thioesterase [Georgfuchsia toluolica]
MNKRKLIYTMQLPIRWADMDALGHVNNAFYFRYMEQARVEWLETIGCASPQFKVAGRPVIVNTSCSFLIALVYPGDVEVRVYAGRAGRSSLPTYYELRHVGDDRLYAEGAAKIVWIELDTGKSIPLPEQIRKQVEGI